jgi:hypothetical protein
MNITTAFNLEDKVYIIAEEQVFSARVKRINPDICANWTLIEYTLEVLKGWAVFNPKTYTESFSEDEIFSSKEEAKKELDIYLKHKNEPIASFSGYRFNANAFDI